MSFGLMPTTLGAGVSVSSGGNPFRMQSGKFRFCGDRRMEGRRLAAVCRFIQLFLFDRVFQLFPLKPAAFEKLDLEIAELPEFVGHID